MAIDNLNIPVGTKALILSKHYYSVLSKSLEQLEVERYFSILYFIHANNGCTQQYICNNLAIDKTAMVKVMDYLIKAGYLSRRVNPDDRREHFVELTRKGMKRTQEIVTAFEKIDAEMFSKVSKSDREVFLNVLEKLSDTLKQMPATDVFFNFNKTGKRKISLLTKKS